MTQQPLDTMLDLAGYLELHQLYHDTLETIRQLQREIDHRQPYTDTSQEHWPDRLHWRQIGEAAAHRGQLTRIAAAMNRMESNLCIPLTSEPTDVTAMPAALPSPATDPDDRSAEGAA